MKRIPLFAFLSLLPIDLIYGQEANNPSYEIDRPAIFDSQPYVEVGGSYEGLSNGYSPWESQYLDLMLPLKENGLVYLQLLNAERFSQVDQSAYLNYAYPIVYGVINIEGSHTHNPQFLSRNFWSWMEWKTTLSI